MVSRFSSRRGWWHALWFSVVIALVGFLFGIANPQGRIDSPLALSVTAISVAAGVAGLVAGGGALLLFHWRGWSRWVVAALLLFILTPLALPGFWPNGQWGISDWDYYFSYHESVRRMVLDGSLVPLWNPYTCGGTAALGDPEFPLFTPTFALELLVGVPLGLRLAAWLATGVGAVGMLLLGKRFGLRVLPAFVAAVVFGFGSVNLLEIIEGHPNIFAAMWVPWIFWSWLGAYRNSGRGRQLWSLVCGLFLALTFYQGGIYLLMYTGLSFLAMVVLARRRAAAVQVTLTAGLWAGGLAALKLLPVLLWLQQFPDQGYANSEFTLSSLHRIFLGRYLHGSTGVIVPQQELAWHEYGAYVGPLAAGLALLGIGWRWRLRSVRLLVGAGLLALLISTAGPWLKPFFDQAPFLPRSSISRIIVLTVIALALLAGFGFAVVQRWLVTITARWPRRLLVVPAVGLAIIVGLLVFDLTSVSTALSQQSFILPPVVPGPSPAPSPLAYTLAQDTIRHGEIDYTRAYASTLAGYGTLSYCSVLGPTSAVLTVQHRDENTSYVVLKDPAGEAHLTSWSPGRFTVDVRASQPAELVINSNYARGWYVNGQPAREYSNRLGTEVPAGASTLLFVYRPAGWQVGAAVTVVTGVAAVAFVLWPRFTRHRVRRAPASASAPDTAQG